MAITIRQSTNSALQYNSSGLSEYLIADNLSGKKFLTNAPTRRILRQNELSVIDFLINDSSFVGGLLKEYKDISGNVLYQSAINLSNSNINVHNSINIDWTDTDIPDGVVSQCVTITENGNLFDNADFELGSVNTFTDWTKVISSATNELLYSQVLNQFPIWNFYGITYGVNATTAPDGTTTAEKIIEDAGFSQEYYIYQNVDLGGSVEACFSFYAKAGERDIIWLQFMDTLGNVSITWFDLAGGAVMTNNNDSAGIDEVGNGWFRCYIVRNNVELAGLSSSVTAGITTSDGVITYLGDGTSGAFFWGGQLELGSEPTSYKATTNSSVTADEGSIVEATRTNLINYSNTFENVAWTLFEANIVANSIISPDGTLTSYKLNASNANNIHSIYRGYVFTSDLTLSFFVKEAEYNKISLTNLSDGGSVKFDLINLTIISSSPNFINARITQEENGFKRISATFTSTTGAKAIGIGLLDNSGNDIFVGSATSGVYIFGAQLESLLFPTSYIPTTINPVTVADGRGGSRAPRFNRLTRDVALYQAVTTIGVQYRVQFWAKYYEGFPELSITDGSVAYDSFALTNEEYQLFDLTFTATSGQVHFTLTSGTDSAIALDDVLLTEVGAPLTETRCFTLDANCYEHENQVQWVNKLGGKDTFMFTGLPIKEKSIQRQNEIKYPVANNFQAPSAIYQSRSISSRESMTIFTRCENEATARWLRDEINDCIAIYLLVGSEYYPIIPETANVQVFNENGFNYQVNMKFKFAFDVNIQTI